jgi:hypothetical protein
MSTESGHTPLRCKVLGHDVSFAAHGEVMVWECRRGCGSGGSKRYASSAEAARYVAAFNTRGSDDLGRNAPLLGMFPLRLWHRWRSKR